MNIEELINEIYVITDDIFAEDFFEMITKIIPEIQKYYSEFINLIPKLNSIGMDISMEVVLNQLTNVADSIESKNMINLFDGLRYEITDTLKYYKEIQDIMNS